MEQRREFLNWTFKELNLKSMDDWYNVPKEKIYELGGGAMLDGYYNDSLGNALVDLYRDYSWQQYKFAKVPHNYFSQEANVIRFISDTERELSIVDPEQWHRVSTDQLKAQGGAHFVQHPRALTKVRSLNLALAWVSSHSLVQVLAVLYPHVDWTRKERVDSRRT